jgi:DNA-binding beta-propeller fold protein YncE
MDPVIQFGPDGHVVKSFGSGMFIWPHGLDVDRDGNVWVTDAVAANRIPKGDKRGHRVVKFSRDGKALMTLGTAGEAGSDAAHFNSPSDVAVAPNGDVLVADGHNDNGNNRVMKFSRDGQFVKSWGKSGWAPGEFHGLHAIAIDSRGRVFVGDRGNNRIQIFDQEGKSLSLPWTQFGKPSGIAFDSRDQIYVADSESDDVQNPGWEMGIRIGDAKSGWVNAFLQFPWADPRETSGNGAEFVAVDRDGNIYGGEPRPKQLRKYVRVRP